MKRSFAIVILPFFCQLLVSCASFDAGNGRSLYSDKRAYEDSVYFVQVPAASPGQSLSDSIIEQTARQIFIRKKVTARYSISGNGDDSSARKTSGQISFDQGNLYALSANLEILTTLTTPNGVQALVRYRDPASSKNIKLPSVKSLGKNGNPEWVTDPPVGLAFYASAEASSARAGAADGFQNADTMAFASLAKHLGKVAAAGTTKQYQATFSGAYIARRWYNPSTNTYYSLAVAPRRQDYSAK